MKLIVAVDEKWGIGKDGDLLLSIPEDMKFFREKTRGKILVMGYNTLISFPGSKPLPGRLNIVLNNEPGCRVSGAVVCRSTEQLYRLLECFDGGDVFVIGGGSIYRQLLPACDTAYITKMRFCGDADTFIPNLDELPEWSVEDESDLYDHDGTAYSFVEYRNSAADGVVFKATDGTLSRYFGKNSGYEALKDGFDAEDVDRFLESGEASFEKYLLREGHIKKEIE